MGDRSRVRGILNAIGIDLNPVYIYGAMLKPLADQLKADSRHRASPPVHWQTRTAILHLSSRSARIGRERDRFGAAEHELITANAASFNHAMQSIRVSHLSGRTV